MRKSRREFSVLGRKISGREELFKLKNKVGTITNAYENTYLD